jgi:hypothetical protein
MQEMWHGRAPVYWRLIVPDRNAHIHKRPTHCGGSGNDVKRYKIKHRLTTFHATEGPGFMGWFGKKQDNSPAIALGGVPVRIHSNHLSIEPGFTALAVDCISAAGSEHHVDLMSVLTGILNITSAQVGQWFKALGRPDDAKAFNDLFELDGFKEQYLWDYLTGDPGKIAIHNQLAELLASAQIHDLITNSILEGHHAAASK